MSVKLDSLKSLDILLYKGKGIISWLVQVGTFSPYNHVSVVSEQSRHEGIESNTGHKNGVRKIDLKKLNLDTVDAFRIKSGRSFDQAKVITFLNSKLGAKFDYAGVTWLGVLKVVNKLTLGLVKTHNHFQKEKDYFCSELCYEAYMAGEIDIVPQIDSAEITSPGDIARSPVLERVT